MIAASGRFDLHFTCEDSTGAATAPTGTPTGVLVKNGADLGATVTVTMTGAKGVASCTIPSDAANGDRFCLRISGVVSGVTYERSGPSETVQNSVTLPTAPTDWLTAAAVKADAVTKIQNGLATQDSVNDIATDAAASALWAKRGAAGVFGLISTAGTDTEVFTLDGVTVTVTVDSSGNRSSVVFS